MVMTPERSKSPRRIAEEMDEHEGFRVEIIGGVLLRSPTPRVKHARIARKLEYQLIQQLPEGLVPNQGISVSSAADDDDFAVPDLTVIPEDYEDTEEWIVPSGEVELVVEIVSPSNAGSDTVAKVGWYARAGVPLYLLIDPRKAAWRLHSGIVNGEYSTTTDGRFGDKLPLPGALAITLETHEFKAYSR